MTRLFPPVYVPTVGAGDGCRHARQSRAVASVLATSGYRRAVASVPATSTSGYRRAVTSVLATSGYRRAVASVPATSGYRRAVASVLATSGYRRAVASAAGASSSGDEWPRRALVSTGVGRCARRRSSAAVEGDELRGAAQVVPVEHEEVIEAVAVVVDGEGVVARTAGDLGDDHRAPPAAVAAVDEHDVR